MEIQPAEKWLKSIRNSSKDWVDGQERAAGKELAQKTYNSIFSIFFEQFKVAMAEAMAGAREEWQRQGCPTTYIFKEGEH